MFHEPAAAAGKDPALRFKSRVGVWMFLLYAIIYGGFVAICVIRPSLMEEPVLLGLNLAVVYGFFLIVFALLLALVYNRACGKKERELSQQDRG